MSSDNVFKSRHYNQRSIECIEFVRSLPFCVGNAFKYIWRAGDKGNAQQDRDKALYYLYDWYLNASPLHGVETKRLVRKLVSISDEFDTDTFFALSAILGYATATDEAIEALGEDLAARGVLNLSDLKAKLGAAA